METQAVSKQFVHMKKAAINPFLHYAFLFAG